MSNKNNNKSPRTNNKGSGLELRRDIVPLTKNQARMFDSSSDLVADGCAGTGKTFGASYMALRDIMYNKLYDKLIYIRSIVPTRDIGFLKGDDKQKTEVYQDAYVDIAQKLFGRGDAYEVATRRDLIHFMPTSFLRGTTIDDAAIIVDECQNMSYHELDTVITRIGQNCRVFFCGDGLYQSDLGGKSGVQQFWKVLKTMDDFDYVTFTTDDIVRSDRVKRYIIARHAVHGDKQLS
jgi:phosphate starvation-inducible PhoH-like protein